MLRQTLVTTLRTATDIGTLPHNALPRLFPAASLRMMDDHLHKSGILQPPSPPRQPSPKDETTVHRQPRLYDHAWLCASQSVQVRPHPGLWDREHVTSHVWVHGVGSSSLQLGHALTTTDDDRAAVLAVAQRVFVRKTWDSGAAPFSADEARRYREDCGLGTTTPIELDQETLPPLVPRSDAAHRGYARPEEPAVWTVPVGTGNVNFGGHADHAFLAETAHHALLKTALWDDEYDYMAFQYLAEVSLGATLHCYAVRNDNNDNDAVVVVARYPKDGNHATPPDEFVPVLLAQGRTT